MNEEIFRKKSLDKVKSPENLDDYIRVAGPGVWLLLVSVILLLAGACVWSVFGHIDSTIPSVVCVEKGAAVCYIDEENISSVQPGMTVRFGDYEAAVTALGAKEDSGYECTLTAAVPAPDGFYEGRVVIRSYRPLSFILN